MSKKNAEQSKAERAAAVILEQERAERRRRTWIITGVVAAVLVIVAGGFAIQSLRDTSGNTTAAPSGVGGSGAAGDQSGPGGTANSYAVVIGDDSAPTTVAVYEDFQCPICQEFEKATLDKLRAAVDDGTIKLEYHMVAFLDGASTTNYSSRALNAAAVVLDSSGPDVFLKFHDLLYDNQPAEGSAGLSDDELVDYAVEAGAKESDVREGIENDDFGQWVVNATDQMSKDGVNGTPTVFVDGKQAGATLGDSISAALAATQ